MPLPALTSPPPPPIAAACVWLDEAIVVKSTVVSAVVSIGPSTAPLVVPFPIASVPDTTLVVPV